MWPFIWKVLGWILRIWCMLKIIVYSYLFVCFGAYVSIESLSARGGWCVRALFNTCVHMSVCVFACVLSFSLRSSLPLPLLSLLVSFFKCKGGTQYVCVCLDVMRQHKKRALARFLCPRPRSGHLDSYARVSVVFCSTETGYIFFRFCSLTLLFEVLESWNFQGR